MTSPFDWDYFHRELEAHFRLHEMVDTIQRMPAGPEKDEAIAQWKEGHHQIPKLLDAIGTEVIRSPAFIAAYLNSKISGLTALEAMERGKAAAASNLVPFGQVNP